MLLSWSELLVSKARRARNVTLQWRLAYEAHLCRERPADNLQSEDTHSAARPWRSVSGAPVDV
jgi:hypothetical protein